MATDFHLGSWAVPSGSVVDVYVRPERKDGTRKIGFRWRAPMRSHEDLRYYLDEIEPAILRRLKEYLEIPSDMPLGLGPIEARR